MKISRFSPLLDLFSGSIQKRRPGQGGGEGRSRKDENRRERERKEGKGQEGEGKGKERQRKKNERKAKQKQIVLGHFFNCNLVGGGSEIGRTSFLDAPLQRAYRIDTLFTDTAHFSFTITNIR